MQPIHLQAVSRTVKHAFAAATLVRRLAWAGRLRTAASGVAVLSVAVTASAADLTLYSAGSLRTAMTALIENFSAHTGIAVRATYGPSGTLRERIEKNDVPDLFASANLEHPEALRQQGLLKDVAVFATNHLCLLAAPGVHLPHDVLNALLDPGWRLATATPKSDPAGDYTWGMFHKADQARPGAYAVLDKKAMQIMGQPDSDGRPLGVLDILAQSRADLVVAYCSYGKLAADKVPGATWAPFPEALDVASRYGIGTAVKADPRASQFVRFVLGTEGKAVLEHHGFSR